MKGLPTLAQLAVNLDRRNVAVSLYAVRATDRRDLGHRRMVNEKLLAFLGTVM